MALTFFLQNVIKFNGKLIIRPSKASNRSMATQAVG